MRILFLSTWFPYPPDNGAKQRVYYLLQALAARHEVELVSLAFGTAIPVACGPVGGFCRRVQAIECDPFRRGRLAFALRFLSPAPIVTAPLPEVTGVVRRSLVEIRPDVVVASTGVMASYALMPSAATARILEEHNCMTRWAHERYGNQVTAAKRIQAWASWQKCRRHEARLFRRFDLVTMVSEQDRQACASLLPNHADHVQVVSNGVDCGHNRPRLTQAQPNTLVFNGSLTYSANFDAMHYFLSDILPLVRDQIPGVSLTITGSVDGANLAGLQLDGRVVLAGMLPDVREAVAGACVCVVPIRHGGGTRLKILEAMALGTPVVSTTKGAEGLEVTPGEHIAIADGPQAFAAQVVQLLRDPGQRERLSRNARVLVETKYDWKEVGRLFVDLVERCVRERQG